MKTIAILLPIAALALSVSACSAAPDAATAASDPKPTVTVTATATQTVAGPVVTETVEADPVAEAAASGNIIEEGIWVVGEDVKAGTYRTIEPVTKAQYCLWTISTTGSNGEDIVSIDDPSGGRPSVTIKKGQDFETEDCGTWTRQ